MSRFVRMAALPAALLGAALHLQALQSSAPPRSEALPRWFCPMHADVTTSGPGQCPKCGMALIQGNRPTSVCNPEVWDSPALRVKSDKEGERHAK